jgi:KUP system potassium uptake protein
MGKTTQGPGETAHPAITPITLGSILAALGVVFGDIGTSPLYAFRECMRVSQGNSNITPDQLVVPALSMIIWSLISVVTVKYVLLMMEANDDGEGGIMTLVSLASSHTEENRKRKHRSALVLLGVFGTAMLYGDGVITPAISVLSALEGIKEANDSMKGPMSADLIALIIPLAAVLILAGIFWLQKRGSGKVGMYFGPITLVWFIAIGATGVWSLWSHSAFFYKILGAINPLEALIFVATKPGLGIIILGSVFLAVTGAEALYADMGHFGQRPIRAGWYFIVFPALILNYLGQGAWALAHSSELALWAQHKATDDINPFFNMAPIWTQIPLVVIATLAAIIASQALISGAFSTTMQAIQLNYLPRMRIERTSDVESGQIYVPIINWLLMIGSIYLVLHYENSGRLASSYGIAVSMTMLATTILYGRYLAKKIKISPVAAYSLVSGFVTLELFFVIGNSHKIWPDGWMALAVGIIVYYIMSVWNKGRIAMRDKLALSEPAETVSEFSQFIDSVEDRYQVGKLSRVRGTAIYLAGNTRAVPLALAHNLKHNKSLHDHIIVVTLNVDEERPIVPLKDRMRFEPRHPKFCNLHQKTEFPLVLRVIGTFGFREQQDIFPVLNAAYAELGIKPNEMETTYFLSRETIVRDVSRNFSLNAVQEKVFEVLNRNALSATAYFNLPPGRVVELGMQVEL